VNTPQTLGALIRDRQASTGWSLRDLSDRSPAGAGLNKARWGELRRDEATTFSGAQLLGIADALGVPESMVGQAALATMGVTAQTGSAARIEDAVRTDNELSEHDRRILLAVLHEMRRERGGNAVSTAPSDHPGHSPGEDSEPRGGDAKNPALEAMLPHEDQEYPAAGVNEDELSHWRREREGKAHSSGRGVAPDAEEDTIPLPYEEPMAGDDAPSKRPRVPEQQDAEAGEPQD
jgi:transcriptional regulator with XRE-family HTH domain